MNCGICNNGLIGGDAKVVLIDGMEQIVHPSCFYEYVHEREDAEISSKYPELVAAVGVEMIGSELLRRLESVGPDKYILCYETDGAYYPITIGGDAFQLDEVISKVRAAIESGIDASEILVIKNCLPMSLRVSKVIEVVIE